VSSLTRLEAVPRVNAQRKSRSPLTHLEVTNITCSGPMLLVKSHAVCAPFHPIENDLMKSSPQVRMEVFYMRLLLCELVQTLESTFKPSSTRFNFDDTEKHHEVPRDSHSTSSYNDGDTSLFTNESTEVPSLIHNNMTRGGGFLRLE